MGLLELLDELSDSPPDHSTLECLIQPGEDSREGTKYLLEAAVAMQLIIRLQDGSYRLDESIKSPVSEGQLREKASSMLLAELPDDLNEDHDFFGAYSSWAMANSATYSDLADDSKFAKFRAAVQRRDLEGTAFGETKYRAWKPWAVFLGLGFVFGKHFVPCPVGRIWDARKGIFGRSPRLEISKFLKKLGAVCPELDGGKNFSRFVTGLSPGTISCATSMALRILSDQKKLKIEQVADASMWMLWEDKGHKKKKISHVACTRETPQ